MGKVLETEIFEGLPHIYMRDEASVSLVREAVRREGAAMGMAHVGFECLAAAASELGHNQIKHAGGGRMAVRRVARTGDEGIVPGLEVLALDDGPGISNPRSALRGLEGAAGGANLGVGLSAVYRLADEVDIDVRMREGTCIAARKFVSPLPRREVVVLGRPCEGQVVSGDNACFVRDNDDLVVGVADGLGHGPEASLASSRVVALLRKNHRRAPVDFLAACDKELQDTRGAVVAVLKIDRKAGRIVHAGAGNVGVQVYRDRTCHQFSSVSRVLGGRAASEGRFVEEDHPTASRQIVVMFTDGVTSRLDLTQDLALLRQPPLLIAQHVIDTKSRADDDVLVVVAT